MGCLDHQSYEISGGVCWVAWHQLHAIFSGRNPLYMGTTEGTCPVVKITRKYESRKQLTWFRCESSIHSTFWRQGVFAEKWCPYRFSWQKLYINTRTHSITENHSGETPVSYPFHVCTCKSTQWTPVRRCLIKVNEKFQCFLPLATLLTSRDDLETLETCVRSGCRCRCSISSWCRKTGGKFYLYIHINGFFRFSPCLLRDYVIPTTYFQNQNNSMI